MGQTSRVEVERLLQAVTVWRRTGIAYVCDNCAAPVPNSGPDLELTGLGEAVHARGCPDLGASYLDGESWSDSEARRLRAVLALWSRVGGFYRCDTCDAPVPTSGPDLSLNARGEAIHARACPVPAPAGAR